MSCVALSPVTREASSVESLDVTFRGFLSTNLCTSVCSLPVRLWGPQQGLPVGLPLPGCAMARPFKTQMNLSKGASSQLFVDWW